LNASYVSTNLQELKSSLDVRESQLEFLREFINIKIQQYGESDLYILCGDLNVDSNPEAVQYNMLEQQMIKSGKGISPQDRIILNQAKNEYKNMVDILSNFGTEKIVDCIQEVIEKESEDES